MSTLLERVKTCRVGMVMEVFVSVSYRQTRSLCHCMRVNTFKKFMWRYCWCKALAKHHELSWQSWHVSVFVVSFKLGPAFLRFRNLLLFYEIGRAVCFGHRLDNYTKVQKMLLDLM